MNSTPVETFCHSWSREQPKAESFFQRPREKENTETGNEAVFYRAIVPIIINCAISIRNLVDHRDTRS